MTNSYHELESTQESGYEEIHLTPAQCRDLDRYAADQLKIPSILLMENAGLNLANLIMDIASGDLSIEEDLQISGFSHLAPNRQIWLFCGGGNNGGDGYTAARHLFNRGYSVKAIEVSEARKLPPDSRIQYDICKQLDLIISYDDAIKAQLDRHARNNIVIDCLLGTGFSGDTIREPVKNAAIKIADLKASGATVISADIPSGLNGLTGQAATSTVQADMTLTFAALKTGFQFAPAKAYLGRVIIGDIGVPDFVIDRIKHTKQES